MKTRPLYHFGKYLLFMNQVLSRPENMRMYFKELVRQMYDIGIGSLVIVMLLSVFFGAVTAIQFYYQIGGTMIPNYYIGYIVRDMALIELAPTFTCMLLAGKVGSNIASEIGGMRQKEHIDAMEIMGINTASYLVMPRMLASVMVVPMLVSFSAAVSIIGGYVACVWANLFTHNEYVQGLHSFFEPYNVFIMFVKAFVFGFVLTTVASYQGYFVKGGSIELGKASTKAVVYANLLILLSDYLIALILT